MAQEKTSEGTGDRKSSVSPPTISLPKGGGAIRGVGEKFAANPVTGTGSLTVPIYTSPGRSGFGPQLSLSYDSGAGNGPFGFGWSLALPSITRKTDKGLPQYNDAEESDEFILSGAEDLVPLLVKVGKEWKPAEPLSRTVGSDTYSIKRYRPRIEGLFARIEKWTNQKKPEDTFWRSISKDNITTWYGKSQESRIADPADPTHIFSWLICASYDDKGNAVLYQYVAEDEQNVDKTQANERNRVRTANRYLKHIYYGNRTPYFPQTILDNPPRAAEQWLFEVLFDYGEHNEQTPTPTDKGIWPRRYDPFSSHRASFEVRTYRLCQRVLMFHRFAELGPTPCLARSTDFTYSYELNPADVRNPIFSFLLSVTQSGYKRLNGNYLKKSLPPLEFTYSQPSVQSAIEEVDAAGLENLPIGLDGATYQWVDLDGEGISGILTEQADGWFYKRNLSPKPADGGNGSQPLTARFAPLELVATKPAASLAGHAQLLDLAGDGQVDLVQMDGPVRGFYERTAEAGWMTFRPFVAWPNIDTRDPNLKFVDLNGDGHSDMLITEDEVFTWHASLAELGFGPATRVSKASDEERGPRLVFNDGSQSIYLADMSGDGLTDLTRIRNGEVCYWPNLGYGRFGAKVTMDNAPWFDLPDQFDQRRIRLADIDGSGVTDIIYLGSDGVHLYFNQSGNSWSHAQTLTNFPAIDNLASVMLVDLLGNGTACLVWSSPLPGNGRQPMRYVDLMGGQKPHLLIKTINNLGLETEVQYAPSTKFYLQDKLAGKPWITKLPFPVHCVEKVTTRDKWRKTAFSTTYSYHHGYFDGVEREFRGFGRVEQVDVENYGIFAAGNTSSPYITADKTLYQPPVKTVTWFHTGVFIDRTHILKQYVQEYFPHWFEALQPGEQVLGDFRENNLPEPDLDTQDLTAEEWREALRAFKGMTLRQEVYELDVDALAAGEQKPVKLFTAAYHNCRIHLVQPRAANKHAVFHVTESEAITYHYELDLRSSTLSPDPRIAHTLNLKIDEYGNIQQALSVVYPRREKYQDTTLQADALALIEQVQSELHLAYTETRHTNDVPNDPPNTPLDKRDLDNYRLRLPCEVLTYELTGIQPTDASDKLTPDIVDDRYFTPEELRAYKLSDKYQADGTSVAELDYHLLPNHTAPQKRLVEHTRTLFFDKDLNKFLPFGQLNALALPYETYTLALTEEILKRVFNDKIEPDVQGVLSDQKTSGYLSGADLSARFGDYTTGQYWRCSGVAGFNADAAQHFYLPERYTDPFGNVTLLEYDTHDLYIKASTDALGNRTEVMKFDCCVLAPSQLKDSNDNLSEVRFDVLGMPAAMAVMGKGNEGDNLDDFDDAALNPNLDALIAFFSKNDYSEDAAQTFLGKASARHLYYFGEIIETDEDNGKPKTVWASHPACACGIVREQHVAQQPVSPVQTALEYSDGAGNVLVKKVQAEPATPGGALRWVASGKTILNNKGKPVKQYEPYFSASAVGHRFEEPHEEGVTPVLYYDAVGRTVRTEMADGSYSRVEFSPWHVRTIDQNDTVTELANAWYAKKTAATATTEEWRAAQLAAQHADTPSLTILDSLGREVITIAHNKVKNAGKWQDEKYLTFTKLDAEGKPLWIRDARKNLVMQYITPPAPSNQATDPTAFVPCYDIAGNLLFQHSMDAGERWMLNDAAGKPIFAWNSRGFRTQICYDALHRPTDSFVSGVDPQNLKRKILFAQMIYGEGQPLAAQFNLRGKLYQHYDGAGLLTHTAYDFKGNLLSSTRRLTVDYKQTPDWSQTPALTNESFVSRTRYDALNRPVQMIAPHSTTATPLRVNVIQPTYNEAGLLERLDVWLSRSSEPTQLLERTSADQHMVTNINYNAKGQRVLIQYGNGAETSYDYEPETFRLKCLQTTRTKDNAQLQDLNYTYDPMGNITQIRDQAQDRVFHSNDCVLPSAEYQYDALYRLVAANGREHKGNGQQVDWDDSPRFVPTLPNDGQALQNYVETYRYDAVGNILQMVHHGGRNLERPGEVLWNRRYQYALDSNRLLATSLPGDATNLADYTATPGYSAPYTYDLHGNMMTMPHLPLMQWDFQDQLQATAQQMVSSGTPETTYYVYDANGQRVRKVTERQAAAGQTPTRSKERLYLGGFEIYREYNGDGNMVTLERETLHIMDDKQRIALVETKTLPKPLSTSKLEQLIRYQFGNHLGSATLELDEQGQIISYEEYTPYGNSTYQAVRSQTEAPKRYRYTGKERDEESGLYYHGARYYAAWLGRWMAADPDDSAEGSDLYAYVQGNPTNRIDPTGLQDEVTIYHRTTSGAALSMTQSGASTTRSRPHVWAGQGFYGSSSPNIPGSVGASGNTIVAQRVTTEQMTTITDERFIAMQQDTSRGRELRRLVRKQLGDQAQSEFRRLGRVPSEADIATRMRDYMSRLMNRLAPGSNVVRWQNPDGTYTYVVREQSALRGNPTVVGQMTERGVQPLGGAASQGTSSAAQQGAGAVARQKAGVEELKPGTKGLRLPKGVGTTLNAAGGVLILLDAAKMAREQRLAEQGYAGRAGRAVLEDDGGEYVLDIQWGLIFNDYYKTYINGPMAGTTKELGFFEMRREIKKRDQKYGYFDWKGDFVPGRVAPVIVYAQPDII